MTIQGDRIKSVTLREVAKATQLSVAAVSQILGKRTHLFSPATQKKVIRAAAKLGYRRNISAWATRTRKFGCVGLLSSAGGEHGRIFVEMIEGIQTELSSRDMHLTLTWLPEGSATSREYMPKTLREYMVDGLLVNYFVQIPQAMIDIIREYGIPAVWINSNWPDDCVYPDDEEATAHATRYLIGLGHRKIVYASYSWGTTQPSGHYSQEARLGGYCSVMEDAGLTSRRIEHPEYLPRCEREAFSLDWLRAPDRPTAVV
ncbi:MAG TPA: hypothetical protein DCX07_09495, partial [Phycisphaerales bacterium]|nr:hypothetical protein [Phycisphaerales bacterium]